jgi:sugar transferase (PEP-CTERM/EpsH1 system associated)
MRILWLNAGLLLPLDKGGKLRTWHLLTHLGAGHDITYLSFADTSVTPEMRAGMRAVCSRLETVPRSDPPKRSARFYADAGRYLIDTLPYAVAKYRSASYAERLRSLLTEEQFDLVVCDFLPPLVNMPVRLPCPAVLFTHNVESEIWRRLAETAGNPVARHLLATQWKRMSRFEGRAFSRFDLVLAVSDVDSKTFRQLYPASQSRPIHVVHTGVDTSFFAPDTAPPQPAHLVFTGSMDWLANEDAMVYFVQEILPLIKDAEPDVTLTIVGRAPTPAVQRLANRSGIQVTGNVDDVRPYIAAATVYVVPLRIGGGTRLKIFEAMSMGKAVVSTTVGAEGLPVTAGHNIRIADGPSNFADAVVSLIRNTHVRELIEREARQLVVQRYDWTIVGRDLEAALVHAARSRPSREAVA